MVVKLFEFQSAVRGTTITRNTGHLVKAKFWIVCTRRIIPIIFAIKTCEKPTGRTVGHLPMEISRSIKYLLQHGAIVEAKR